MIHFTRPPEPEAFRDRVREARRAVEQAIEAGEAPVFDDSLWKPYKEHFACAQHGKCAYCEMAIANHDPHVEHFAPKAEVWEPGPDEADRGREIASHLPNIRGRRPGRRIAPGYWWLAYEWTNFLVACSVCNTKGKQCYFPVAEEPRQRLPQPDVRETRLLLNPYDDEQPWRHFRFSEFGQVTEAHASARGHATIATCNLDRESLRLPRQGPAKSAYRHAEKLASPVSDESERKYALENLCELGSDDRAHAGMVRAIAEQVTGLHWEELLHLRDLGRGHAPSSMAGD